MNGMKSQLSDSGPFQAQQQQQQQYQYQQQKRQQQHQLLLGQHRQQQAPLQHYPSSSPYSQPISPISNGNGRSAPELMHGLQRSEYGTNGLLTPRSGSATVSPSLTPYVQSPPSQLPSTLYGPAASTGATLPPIGTLVQAHVTSNSQQLSISPMSSTMTFSSHDLANTPMKTPEESPNGMTSITSASAPVTRYSSPRASTSGSIGEGNGDYFNTNHLPDQVYRPFTVNPGSSTHGSHSSISEFTVHTTQDICRSPVLASDTDTCTLFSSKVSVPVSPTNDRRPYHPTYGGLSTTSPVGVNNDMGKHTQTPPSPSNPSMGGPHDSSKANGSFLSQHLSTMGSKPNPTSTLDRLRRRRENHNHVERRRRDHINSTIRSLANLLPDRGRGMDGQRRNKGAILEAVVEWMTEIQTENTRLREENVSLRERSHLLSPRTTFRSATMPISTTSDPMAHYNRQKLPLPSHNSTSGSYPSETTVTVTTTATPTIKKDVLPTHQLATKAEEKPWRQFSNTTTSVPASTLPVQGQRHNMPQQQLPPLSTLLN